METEGCNRVRPDIESGTRFAALTGTNLIESFHNDVARFFLRCCDEKASGHTRADDADSQFLSPEIRVSTRRLQAIAILSSWNERQEQALSEIQAAPVSLLRARVLSARIRALRQISLSNIRRILIRGGSKSPLWYVDFPPLENFNPCLSKPSKASRMFLRAFLPQP